MARRGARTPSSWDGAQAIIGQFFGPGSNAVQAYDPSTGVAFLLPGESNGTVNTSQETNLVDVFDFQPYLDASGDTNASPDNALQLANAYNVSGNNAASPDEIGTYTDPTLGGFLAYFVSAGFPGAFDPTTPGPYILTNTTVDPGTSTDAGWNTGSTLNTLQGTQINGGPGLIDVTSTGQVQSWTVDIDDSTATATIAQANAANSSQLLQTDG
jgi:hypothetical protein